MIGLNPGPLSPVELRENQRVTNEVVDELYFRFDLMPGMGILGGGSTIQTMAGNTAVTVRFPNAATSYWVVNLPLRQRFQVMSYKVKTIYSTLAADAGAYTVQTALWLTTPGGVLTTDPSIAVNFTLPGLGALNAEGSQENIGAFPATPISTYYDLLRFRYLRVDPDANATSLDVLSLIVTLYGRSG